MLFSDIIWYYMGYYSWNTPRNMQRCTCKAQDYRNYLWFQWKISISEQRWKSSPRFFFYTTLKLPWKMIVCVGKKNCKKNWLAQKLITVNLGFFYNILSQLWWLCGMPNELAIFCVPNFLWTLLAPHPILYFSAPVN